MVTEFVNTFPREYVSSDIPTWIYMMGLNFLRFFDLRFIRLYWFFPNGEIEEYIVKKFHVLLRSGDVSIDSKEP